MNIKKFLIVMVAVLIAFLLLGRLPARACSAFVLAKDGRVLFGRNFDYFTGAALLTVNPRDLEKTALVYPGVTAAHWTAKYGSITFNQVSRDFPMGGMNEKGLVVECLWLPQTQYPAPDARPVLTELQWIQYMLDTCATADEVVAADSLVRIFPSTTKLHFLIADASGAAAVIEYQGGRSLLYGPGKAVVPALTNTSYGDDLESLAGYNGFGGQKEVPAEWTSSTDRFIVLAGGLRRLQRSPASIEDADVFALLDVMSYEGPDAQTQWQIVYDPAGREVRFKTRANRETRAVKLGDFDLACGQGARVYDVRAADRGDVGRLLIPATLELNLAFTRETFETYWKAGFSKEMNPFVVGIIGSHPSTNRCRAAAGGHQ
jgi:penicillin V acylase-like amidase (Ntn superfamily)